MISIAPALAHRLRRPALALALACALAPLAAQESAQVRRATELRERPDAASPVLATLPASTPLTRVPGRRGPWVQVRTGSGQVGWVHLFDLGREGPGSRAGGGAGANPLRSVAGLFSPAGPASTSTSASGIRGLEAEELARAQPDAGAVGRMEALRLSEQQARDYARQVAWRPQSVPPLAAPSRGFGGGSAGASAASEQQAP